MNTTVVLMWALFAAAGATGPVESHREYFSDVVKCYDRLDALKSSTHDIIRGDCYSMHAVDPRFFR